MDFHSDSNIPDPLYCLINITAVLVSVIVDLIVLTLACKIESSKFSFFAQLAEIPTDGWLFVVSYRYNSVTVGSNTGIEKKMI